ncbi:theronine dehydrogenase [Oenococcus oeni S25]|uniref:alcohol dehydrogenase catalytic domain-containing protein n=1 Tax=Oenococcus oeni TaxID=1247 RepID=UPI00050E378F|nr:alcohol dehydrogenase catalytic domain-containing protein [Oenococcus oeni]KGO15906.1 theronine dehydrogenase [Oenococcus oeni X2L]KGH55596.1 theronine dehydrogenase [Oenococcus oeni S22]KGH70181.1 theronine dehydrogenase [Oenococcus oeni S25]KGH79932.1 theronine dehydrogenase [Oenococcus oeni IOEB_0607]KGH88665.1 theronine dehydrogenase [Oenococcus oeni IOEB_L26_1]
MSASIAQVLYGPKDMRLEKVDIPDPGKDQVQISVYFNGICGSDIHEYLDGMDLATVEHPITHEKAPLISGHEFAGKVKKIGALVKGLKVGDHVTVEPIIACGYCAACRSGNYNLCENSIGEDNAAGFLGFSANGGLSQLCNVSYIYAHKLPDDLPLSLGALCEPTAVAAQAIFNSKIHAGDDVLISGAGPIGLLTAILAKISGAHDVMISDVSTSRLQIAEKLGIGIQTIDLSKKKSVREEIKKLTDRQGTDIAFECSGNGSALDADIDALKFNGKLVQIALFSQPPLFDVRKLLKKGGSLLTSYGYANMFDKVIKIIDDNRSTFEKIITKTIPLEEVVSSGINLLISDKKQAKILVKIPQD